MRHAAHVRSSLSDALAAAIFKDQPCPFHRTQARALELKPLATTRALLWDAHLTRLAVGPVDGTSGKVTLKVTVAIRSKRARQAAGPFTSSAEPTIGSAGPAAEHPCAWCVSRGRAGPGALSDPWQAVRTRRRCAGARLQQSGAEARKHPQARSHRGVHWSAGSARSSRHVSALKTLCLTSGRLPAGDRGVSSGPGCQKR